MSEELLYNRATMVSEERWDSDQDATTETTYSAAVLELQRMNNTPSVGIVQRSHYDAQNHNRFVRLKNMVDNGLFLKPVSKFHMMSDKAKLDFENEIDQRQKIKLADTYAMHLCLERDTMSMLRFDGFDSKRADTIFKELKALVPHTSCPTDTEICLFGRKAIHGYISGDALEGKTFLMVAKFYACNTSSICFPIASIFYMEIYILVYVFEQSPSQSKCDKIYSLGWDRISRLDCLQSDDCNPYWTFWRQRIIIKVIFCLLGITNSGREVSEFTVRENNIAKAQKLIQNLNRTWSTENPDAHSDSDRIRMMYYIAKSKMGLLSDDLEDAIEYIQRAENIAVKHSFPEMNEISSRRKLLSPDLKPFVCEEYGDDDLFEIDHADLTKMQINDTHLRMFEDELPFSGSDNSQTYPKVMHNRDKNSESFVETLSSIGSDDSFADEVESQR